MCGRNLETWKPDIGERQMNSYHVSARLRRSGRLRDLGRVYSRWRAGAGTIADLVQFATDRTFGMTAVRRRGPSGRMPVSTHFEEKRELLFTVSAPECA
jgi:hypothetical protein